MQIHDFNLSYAANNSANDFAETSGRLSRRFATERFLQNAVWGPLFSVSIFKESIPESWQGKSEHRENHPRNNEHWVGDLEVESVATFFGGA